MWMQRTTYSQPWHQDEVGWLVLRSTAFTPEESPRYSFYRRGVDLRTSLDTNERRKSPPLRHLGSNSGRPARSPEPCRLIYLAHILLRTFQYNFTNIIIQLFNIIESILEISYLMKDRWHCVKKLYYLRKAQCITDVTDCSTDLTKHVASTEYSQYIRVLLRFNIGGYWRIYEMIYDDNDGQ